MSINVTVTGNPVSIKRGKMVTTTDPQAAKKEFDKRRLLRLEQVRQQSKDLAENVRNKVQKEKKRQMGQIEKEGKEKLKNWQNRKLLDLQNQYLDALDEMGMGHKEADNFADESETLNQQKLENEKMARDRGKLAETKVQIEKNEKNFKKALPIQHKKIVRDIENTRAAMVSAMKRKSPAKKKVYTKTKKNRTSTDINISIPNDSDFSETSSSSSESSKQLPSISEEEKPEEKLVDSEGFCECTESSEEDVQKQPQPVAFGKTERFCYGGGAEKPSHLIEEVQARPTEISMETRISDRIRQRRFKAAQPDYCDLAEAPAKPEIFECPNFRQTGSKFVQKVAKDPLELSSDGCVCTKKRSPCPCKPQSSIKSTAVQTDLTEKCISCKCGSARTMATRLSSDKGPPKDIPTKSPIKLKDLENSSIKPASSAPKVKHYDFPNRFVSEHPSTSQVERIDGDSIEVMPNLHSERERMERMRQRDREAQERGRKALEKERVRRDYEELMQKLPMLQRKEQISRIGSERPEYHMSEERLKERERERQNRLENAYLQAVPELKPKIVTLPKKKPEPQTSDQPFDVIDRDDPRSLNLGKWDTDQRQKTMFTAEEVQEIIKAFTVQKPEDRKSKLKQLLKSLRLQKEQLINEIRALPRDDSIDALLGDLTSFSDDGDNAKAAKKNRRGPDKKRRMEESDTSNTSQEGVAKKSGKPKRRSVKKPRVLVLQNTSTQTTPKVAKEQSASTQSESEPPKKTAEHVKICRKSHVPCDCRSGTTSEEICKIFIKLGEEDATANVQVLPKEDQVAKRRDAATSPKEPKKSPKKATSPKEPQKSPKEAADTRIKENVPPLPYRTEVRKPKPRSRKESWREQLSKNTISTSSTSYYSPPDFNKHQTTSETTASFLSVKRKPQQTDQSEQLANYIKRLLSMSKKSVEDLGVSSSDVPTPSQSVIEMESNNPLAALQEALRLIGAYTPKNVTPSLEATSAPPNTSVDSSGDAGSSAKFQETEKITGDLLSQYADVTDSCTKRIANLAAMIEQLRQEKLRMMRSPPLAPPSEEIPLVSPNFSDDKDNSSTKYFDFPPHGEKSNSTASMDEEELNRRLLEIDMSLAEKLKKFRDTEALPGPPQSPEQPDQQFLERLQKLIRDERQKDHQPETEASRPFVKFLVDIPKLPILEPEPEGQPLNESVRKRPPPSKGLNTAKKFNGNISLVPHELSTIVEADSQLSTKISPNASKTIPTQQTDAAKSPEKAKTSQDASTSSKSLTCTESTCTNICSSWSKSQESSSNSSGDLKSIEAMLKSIGMEWAIPTLHKTQEALALTSTSTSSVDDFSSGRKKTSARKSASASEISLKEFLRKQTISKISSSSLNKSDASPASFVRECSDISAIQMTSSAEKAKQRTSTPVLSTKSSLSKSKEEQQHLFTGVSDISTVRGSSDDQLVSAKEVFKTLGGEDESSGTKTTID